MSVTAESAIAADDQKRAELIALAEKIEHDLATCQQDIEAAQQELADAIQNRVERSWFATLKARYDLLSATRERLEIDCKTAWNAVEKLRTAQLPGLER